MSGAESFANGEDGVGEGVVEARGKCGNGDAGQQIVGGVFEFDDGLAYLGHRVTDAQQSRHSVEEASRREASSSVNAMGSSDTLPDVITSGPPNASSTK